jgi:predicted DNA-binding transcriptional regulator AlpA
MSNNPGRLSPRVISPWYTVRDMCVLFSCQRRCIWTWVQEKKLPEPVRKGKGWSRWPRKAINEILRKMGAEPPADPMGRRDDDPTPEEIEAAAAHARAARPPGIKLQYAR